MSNNSNNTEFEDHKVFYALLIAVNVLFVVAVIYSSIKHFLLYPRRDKIRARRAKDEELERRIRRSIAIVTADFENRGAGYELTSLPAVPRGIYPPSGEEVAHPPSGEEVGPHPVTFQRNPVTFQRIDWGNHDDLEEVDLGESAKPKDFV
ncbi:hypothetical protein F4819DRAFT_486193 [Hypoxylon fuscum]|nr:hypothetical protein F4819DRAFT_486193 [Hypoxylon fuscum]